jgi:hypothetical protein
MSKTDSGARMSKLAGERWRKEPATVRAHWKAVAAARSAEYRRRRAERQSASADASDVEVTSEDEAINVPRRHAEYDVSQPWLDGEVESVTASVSCPLVPSTPIFASTEEIARPPFVEKEEKRLLFQSSELKPAQDGLQPLVASRLVTSFTVLSEPTHAAGDCPSFNFPCGSLLPTKFPRAFRTWSGADVMLCEPCAEPEVRDPRYCNMPDNVLSNPQNYHFPTPDVISRLDILSEDTCGIRSDSLGEDCVCDLGFGPAVIGFE